MGKKLLALLLTISSFYSFAQTRPGSLRGTIIDAQTGESLPFVNIAIKDNSGAVITGGTTDFDGKYNINPVAPGTFQVEVTYTGYAKITLSDIIISPNSPTVQDFKMREASSELDAVTIVYEAPLIDKTKSSKVTTAEDIQNMAVRDITSVAAQAAGVTQDANGNTNIRGARGEGTVYFIDGVKVRGATNIPQAAIQQTEVITGGLPAQYGDAVGGVISTTTKGPSGEYFGNVEILTSSPFEVLSTDAFGDYDYNLAALTMGGPIYKNKKGQPIVGFLFSSEFEYQKESRPTAIPYVKLDDNVLADIENTPIILDPSGNSVQYRSEYVNEDQFSDIDYQQNGFNNEIRLNGNVQIKTSRSTNLTLGGRWTYSNDKRNSYGNHIFNYSNNLRSIDSDWSSYVRFQQQFGTSADDNSSLIKNAFYNIQVDYTRTNTRIFDDRYEEDYFRYGHVGRFDVIETPGYVFSEVETDSGTVSGWTYVGDNPVRVDFEQGPDNRVRGNYTSTYFDLAAENDGLSVRTLDDIRGVGVPVNGTNPRSLYDGLWGSPGSIQSVSAIGVTSANYYKDRNSQFRVTASTNFDIKDHSLIVGFEYEQRSDRAYALNASSLWQRMDLLQNSGIEELDVDNPVFVTVDGEYQDTINYNRLYNADSQSELDRNVRLALGMDPASLEKINIHELDPSLFSLDMFSADELVNPNGIRSVGYYGFDYTGNILDQQPTISDFFTDRDEDGNLTRPVGAFQPIYIAGYIQDQFTFNDLTFNIGVRVDRFDLNQQVLKDPFVLYPVYSVKDIPNTDLSGEDIPASVGGDYVVYVSSFDYGTAQVVGYRDPSTNQWFDALGEPLANPQDLASAGGGSIKPFLVNPPVQVENEEGELVLQDQTPTAASFKDYDPQTVVMPRVAFNFPITDEALFIAHYDVLAQRPSTGLSRLDPFDYLDLSNKRASSILNNPDLRPQKTTEYELGFKQTLTDRSALKISAFYRELRDLIQTVSFTQAYPITYIAYGNLDFGTVKGFSLEYELRRTNNIKLDANYTLQFADGTGSSATSGANLANAGQPNLRYILPLTFDNRHQILVRFDYRYGSGARYDGPVWGNSRVFENAGINITMNAISGQPYTKRDAPYPVTLGNPSSISQVSGQINGARLPWQTTFDARINKVFSLSKEKKNRSLEVYVQILNLFNTKNVVNVYAYTGSAEDDGYLASSSAQSQIEQQTNSRAFVDQYNRRVQSPFNYSLPRRVRLGVSYNF
ncbi:MAG: carboxypeptidase-like regulatory domain-containing protein [Owenweeksia sp.]